MLSVTIIFTFLIIIIIITTGQRETKFRYFVSEERSKAVSESTGWSTGR